MFYAESKNRVIQISDEQAELYASKGYIIKNANGEVVKSTTPLSIQDVLDKLAEKDREIVKLNATIAELKRDLALASAPKVQPLLEQEVVEEPKVVEKKPARKSNKVTE